MQKISLYQQFNPNILKMLDREEAIQAILGLYKDIEGFEIGNPVPFVRSYDKTTSTDFNNMMLNDDGDTYIKIFYGTITWMVYSEAIGNKSMVVSYYSTLDGSVQLIPIKIIKRFLTTNADFIQGITQGVFAQQISCDTNTFISLDGYLFSIQQLIK